MTMFGDSSLGRGSPSEIYANNFRDMNGSVLLGDVSTTYSMIPDHPDVPACALELLGTKLKIIYIVRQPVQRTISHHQHMMNQAEGLGPDINLEINREPALIQYSCYAEQLEPWLDRFGRESILVVKFEDYVADRAGIVSNVFSFLGLNAYSISTEDDGANRTGTARVAGPTIRRVVRSSMFQRIARPLMPTFLRDWMKPVLLRKTKHATIAPTIETVDKILKAVRPDMERLQQMVGWSEPAWDLDEVRDSFLEAEDA